MMTIEEPSPAAGAEAARPPGLSRATVALFAAAAGLGVANIYTAQPLLDVIGQDLDIAPASVGIVVTLTQLGYALGLVLVVPLGDLLDRRRLIVGQAALSAAALVMVGLAPGAGVLLVGMVCVGLLAVMVQVLVAFAAVLARPEERGRAVGAVTGGVVTGILLARLVAGTLADLGGWRLVYLASAGLMLLMAFTLWRVLPRRRPAEPAKLSYAELLRSTARLFLQEPVLRIRAVLALLIFAAFSTLWSAMVLPLGAPPFSLSHTEVGLFGLAGMAGALAAGRAGVMADKGYAQQTTGAALVLLLAAWVPIAAIDTSLWMLALGVVILDLAVQAVHVTSQSMILAARPDAGSRLVGGYMVFYAIGSASGAIASTTVYGLAGWPGVCVLGAAISAGALLFFALTCRHPARSGTDCPRAAGAWTRTT